MMKLRIATIPRLILTLVLALWPAFPSRALGQGQRGAQEPQQPDVIKVNTALVTVPVVVTDRYGQFVTGLSQNDFKLHENGKPQQIASFTSTEAPFNVALLIDTSRSTKNKLGAIRKAALNFVKQLQPNDRVLIGAFDEKVNFIGDFTNDRREIERAIRSVKSSYLTSLYDAIYLTITEKLAPIKGRPIRFAQEPTRRVNRRTASSLDLKGITPKLRLRRNVGRPRRAPGQQYPPGK